MSKHKRRRYQKLSAVSLQFVPSLTMKFIQGIRNDSDLFYQTVRKKAERIDDLNNQSCLENDAGQITLSGSLRVAMRKSLMQLSHTSQLQLKAL